MGFSERVSAYRTGLRGLSIHLFARDGYAEGFNGRTVAIQQPVVGIATMEGRDGHSSMLLWRLPILDPTSEFTTGVHVGGGGQKIDVGFW